MRLSAGIITLLLFGASLTKAQHQQWYTAEVAVEVGRMPCDNCVLGRGDEQPIGVGKGRLTPVTMFYFDTIATYAQGRIVDLTTGRPIVGAVIQARYTCWEGCDVKTAATNQAGFFHLGWVGCRGPEGERSNRHLLVQAAGYQPISTVAVKFGGGAYLHIELAQHGK